MSVLIIIILGIIQGITEFLPVSSSGHVLIAGKLLGNVSSFEFDVLVSFGTVLAVLIYYRKRFASIVSDIVLRRDFNLALKLVVATIPAVVAGFLLQSIIEKYLHSTPTVIAMLLIVGLLMILSSRWQPKPSLKVNKDLHNVTYRQALLIGIVQCISLLSGSSRSGVTILAGLRLGFTKKMAAEWSFLMSVPVILGASLKVLVSEKGMRFVSENTLAFVLANVVSLIAGLLAIKILMKILQQHGLYWFGWYRIGLAVVLIILLSAKIIR